MNAHVHYNNFASYVNKNEIVCTGGINHTIWTIRYGPYRITDRLSPQKREFQPLLFRFLKSKYSIIVNWLSSGFHLFWSFPNFSDTQLVNLISKFSGYNLKEPFRPRPKMIAGLLSIKAFKPLSVDLLIQKLLKK